MNGRNALLQERYLFRSPQHVLTVCCRGRALLKIDASDSKDVVVNKTGKGE